MLISSSYTWEGLSTFEWAIQTINGIDIVITQVCSMVPNTLGVYMLRAGTYSNVQEALFRVLIIEGWALYPIIVERITFCKDQIVRSGFMTVCHQFRGAPSKMGPISINKYYDFVTIFSQHMKSVLQLQNTMPTWSRGQVTDSSINCPSDIPHILQKELA